MGGWRPGDANARGEAPLALPHQSVARPWRAIVWIVAGDLESRIYDSVGVGIVRIQTRVERGKLSVFLRERPVKVPTQSERHGEIATQFVVVVDECTNGIGTIIAIRRAGESRRVIAGAEIAFGKSFEILEL